MINNNSLISIITVVYNGAKCLENTILSIINQAYNNIEYIIIDGGSTDGTIDIIKKYDDKITYWISEPDKGIYDAMNKGIDIAKGDWINFMNAGDEFVSNNILNEIQFYNYNEWDIIYGNHYQIEDNKKRIIIPEPFFRNNRKFKNVGICHQVIFVPVKLAKLYPFNLKYKICSDFDMLYKLWSIGCNFQYVPLIISTFYWGDGMSTKIENILSVNSENAEILGVKYNFKFLFTQLKSLVKIIISKYH